jgi:segregation and condensation protein A
MTDQVFELENFRGPMDLLLHLIREQEMEILDVDLSKLCDQYLVAIELMKAVDINVAGEFLVMASTLILIKSRSILPREEEVDLEEELDPGDELIQQLLEYRKFKSLSMELGDRATEAALRHPRGTSEVPPDPGTELEEIGLWDLVGSFVRLMEEIGLKRDFHTLTLEKPLREYMRDTLKHLASSGEWTLKDLILQSGGADNVLGVFLSLLELVKTQQVVVTQAATREPITVALREDRDPTLLHFPMDEELPGGETPMGEEDEPHPPAHPLSEEDELGDDTSRDLAASDTDSIVSPFMPQADEATGA